MKKWELKSYNLIWILLSVLSSCNSTKSVNSKSDKDKNNVVSTEISGTNINSNKASTKIIFEGTNNIFDIVKHNTFFFDKGLDVIIIKGDNNIFKLYNINLVVLAKSSLDTLIIVGNKERYVLLHDNEVHLKKSKISIDSILVKTPKYDFSKLNSETDVTFNSTIKYYEGQIEKGNYNAYYELAEIFNYGLREVPVNLEKAKVLYEYGVVNNDIESIRRLGNIWYNLEKNKIKGIYYYKLGANLNDSYCIETLQEISKK